MTTRFNIILKTVYILHPIHDCVSMVRLHQLTFANYQFMRIMVAQLITQKQCGTIYIVFCPNVIVALNVDFPKTSMLQGLLGITNPASRKTNASCSFDVAEWLFVFGPRSYSVTLFHSFGLYLSIIPYVVSEN